DLGGDPCRCGRLLCVEDRRAVGATTRARAPVGRSHRGPASRRSAVRPHRGAGAGFRAVPGGRCSAARARRGGRRAAAASTVHRRGVRGGRDGGSGAAAL
ncbi:MAG: putative membrane protein, partial [uncultured Nocardioidaceae bacterium]